MTETKDALVADDCLADLGDELMDCLAAAIQTADPRTVVGLAEALAEFQDARGCAPSADAKLLEDAISKGIDSAMT